MRFPVPLAILFLLPGGTLFAAANEGDEGEGLDVLHYAYSLTFDETPGRLEGKAEITLTASVSRLSRIVLDAFDLDVKRVLDEKGAALSHTLEKGKLIVDPGEPVLRGEKRKIEVAWSGTPRGGLFWNDRRAYGVLQIWTVAGAGETSRWLPCHDRRDDRATLEMTLRFSDRYSSVSNGRFLGNADVGGWRTSRWRETLPLPPGRFACHIGAFERGEAELSTDRGSVNVACVAPIGRMTKKECRERAEETARHLKELGERLGVSYPHVAFTRVLVPGLPASWGTAHSVSTVSSPEDDGLDGLLMQWVGAFLSPASGDAAWLEEGLAAYLALLHGSRKEGEDFLEEELDRHRRRYLALAGAGLDAPLARACRPVRRAKGIGVMRQLHVEMGEKAFFEGIRLFLVRHAGRPFTVDDFWKAMETTRVFEGFRDWADRPGIPRLRVVRSWSDGTLSLSVTQLSDPFWRTRLIVEVRSADREGRLVNRTYAVVMKEVSRDFHFPSHREPEMVDVNPDRSWLMGVEFPRSSKEHALQVRLGPTPARRVRGLRGWASTEGPKEPLPWERLILERGAWVRREAVGVLASEGDEKVRDLLLRLSEDPDPAVRADVLGGLERWASEPEVERRLRDAASHDENPACRGKAARALGNGGEDASVFLCAMLNAGKTPSELASILEGLGACGSGESFSRIREYLGHSRYFPLRRSAAAAVLRHLRRRPDAAGILTTMAGDSDPVVVLTAIDGMREKGDDIAKDLLRHLEGEGLWTNVREYAGASLDVLRKKEMK